MTNNTSIAVVDDDRGVCTSMSRLLRLARFHPVSYASAEAFLADPKHLHFDCLVLDVHMGGMSGLELFAQIAADPTHPPVIFIAALDEPAVRAKAEALGCAAFFRKSSPGTDIIEAISRATRDLSSHRSPGDGSL